MTASPGETPLMSDVDLPTALVEYADRLLLSTGLHAEDALLLASGQVDGPSELAELAIALRAGWELMAEDPA